MVDRAQLLPVARSSAARRSSPTSTTATGSTSARRRSTCRCTATSWTAAIAAPPFAGAPARAWVVARRAHRGGRDDRGPVLHRRGRGRQGRRAHRPVLGDRPPDAGRRRTRSSTARSSGRTAGSAARPWSRGAIVGRNCHVGRNAVIESPARCSATRPSSPTTARSDDLSTCRSPQHLQGLRRPRPLSVARSTRTRARQIGRGFVAYLRRQAHRRVARHARCRRRRWPRRSSRARARRAPTSSTTACCGTDMMYFAVVRDGLDGGAQITASHNPKEYNGIKMVRREAFPLSGDAGIGDIRDMIAGGTAAAAGRRRRARSTHARRARRLRREGHVVHRPVDHQAVQRRARRRQRHGRPGRAAALRAAALQDDARSASRSTARSPTTRPIRSSRRTAATSPSG